MLLKIFLFIIGLFLTAIGITHIICYSNLITVGYSLKEYVNYIIRQIECLYTVFGILLMLLVIYLPKGDNK